MIEHATLEGREVTASMASEVVACSRTIRSLGKDDAILFRWVRKCFSAFKIEMFCISTPQIPFRRRRRAVERMTHLLVIGRHLPMQIQNHPLLLHSLENGIVNLIILNPTSGIGSNSSRIGFHTLDPSLGCLPDFIGSNVGVKV